VLGVEIDADEVGVQAGAGHRQRTVPLAGDVGEGPGAVLADRALAPGAHRTAARGARRQFQRDRRTVQRRHLDLGAEGRLRERHRDGHRQVMVDLSGLEFLSAAGLTVFLRADQALRGVGGWLVLTSPTRMARRVLGITGLAALLRVEPGGRQWASRVAHAGVEGAR